MVAKVRTKSKAEKNMTPGVDEALMRVILDCAITDKPGLLTQAGQKN